MLLALTDPDSFNWPKRVQQVQFKETQIPHHYWYITFSCGLFLLVVYELVFKSIFFQYNSVPYSSSIASLLSIVLSWCAPFKSWFSLTLLLWSCSTAFFFILCVLCLANIGLAQCLSLGSLLVHDKSCYIQGGVYVLCSQTSGFVQCYSLGLL